mmetsp:Transcript_37937/g.90108  ORF Transcript_37937/g.90108 Transcript_37937/m.90108 type:complete len:290 (+) Transcript_37937:174-1043(+)
MAATVFYDGGFWFKAVSGAIFFADKLFSLGGEWWMYALFGLAVVLAMELLSASVPRIGSVILTLQGRRNSGLIPARGRHLDALEATDYVFIAFNRLTTPVFTFHAMQFLWQSPRVVWGARDATAASVLLALAAMFVVYDSTYCLFHRALHHRSVYKHVHKHHHRQMAPSRGNVDAVNVHPFEFLPGEYNHLFAIWAVSRAVPVHAGAALLFIVSGGVLASLNHTRLDIASPVLPWLFKVKYHDVHHWDPSVNFGQYTMIWDYVFRSFRAYPGEGGREPSWAPARGVKSQ